MRMLYTRINIEIGRFECYNGFETICLGAITVKIEHLRYLVEIRKQHSISSAARNLYIGQTTLSAIVRSVENELEFVIFQRTPRGVYPTAAGNELLGHAEEILLKYDEMLRLKDKSKGISYPATLLVSSTFSVALPVAINERVLTLAPKSTLIFDTAPRSQIFARLINNEANIAIVHLRQEDIPAMKKQVQKNSLVIEPLRDDHFYLCVNKNHPLAGLPSISPHTMPPVNVASVKDFYKVGEVESLFSAASREGSSYTVFPNVESACHAVESQNIAALFTGYLVATQVDPDKIAAIPVEEMDNMREIDICVIRRHNRSLSYLEKLLLEQIRDYFAGLELPCPDMLLL